MDIYSFLRELADSWILLSLVLFFLGACLFVFRPGAGVLQRDAAESIFRNEKGPLPAGDKEVE